MWRADNDEAERISLIYIVAENSALFYICGCFSCRGRPDQVVVVIVVVVLLLRHHRLLLCLRILQLNHYHHQHHHLLLQLNHESTVTG